jgi:ABC-type nitrate/sulfonate/bicarbonate transport system substrate-binding protein
MLRRQFLHRSLTAAAGATLSAGHPAARAASLEAVKIVSTSGTTNLVLTALLRQRGYLQAWGIDPTFINVADGNKVVAALISGDVDICPLAGFTQVLAAIAKGAPLKIIAGGADKNFNAIFSGNPQVKTLKDLQGHSVGVGALGTQLHQTMIALFRKYGVDGSKVTFANIGASVDVFKAVQAHVVDAGPAEVWLQGNSGLHILEHGKTFESLPEFVNQAAFTSDRAIARKRDVLVRTLAAYARLYRFIMHGDSEAAFITASASGLGRNDPDFARAQWTFYRQIQPFAGNLLLTEDRVRFMQELNVTTGTQKEVVPFNRVADMSLARDALKRVS